MSHNINIDINQEATLKNEMVEPALDVYIVGHTLMIHMSN